jgi:hypothetical protein
MPQTEKSIVTEYGTNDCDGSRCDWSWSKSGFACQPGEGGCFNPVFCEAEISDFHTVELEEATKKLNRIIAKIPKDPRGRKLSLCLTHRGFLLAWTNRGKGRVAKSAVTRGDSDAKVDRALKLKK